jgi:hypothetical protein
VYVRSGKFYIPGLDSEGVPTGFTITGDNGVIGKFRLLGNKPTATDEGSTLATQAITTSGGPNVILTQKITVDGNGTTYEAPYASIGVNGVWQSAQAAATKIDFERTSNGQYLVTVTISLISTPTSGLSLPVNNRGYDLVGAPKTITTRLLLNESKTQILAQSIYVEESVKAKG